MLHLRDMYLQKRICYRTCVAAVYLLAWISITGKTSSETFLEFRESFDNVFPCSDCSPLRYAKVCASSNETFDSECHLEEFNCVNNENLEVLYYGDCNEHRETGELSNDGSWKNNRKKRFKREAVSIVCSCRTVAL
ncbi:uncharacterized protein LOC130046880 [Ostrea edulis]|uniref:uncharacterized protein LOC130046880 n=1 Tax=Ostrea edulis TaxID=37623 RepID=UPI0024AF429A|nr:uncharacterized protein LOC130046880 [Ostrea edulis]